VTASRWAVLAAAGCGGLGSPLRAYGPVGVVVSRDGPDEVWFVLDNRCGRAPIDPKVVATAGGVRMRLVRDRGRFSPAAMGVSCNEAGAAWAVRREEVGDVASLEVQWDDGVDRIRVEVERPFGVMTAAGPSTPELPAAGGVVPLAHPLPATAEVFLHPDDASSRACGPRRAEPRGDGVALRGEPPLCPGRWMLVGRYDHRVTCEIPSRVVGYGPGLEEVAPACVPLGELFTLPVVVRAPEG
jgi:hypothetical protein